MQRHTTHIDELVQEMFTLTSDEKLNIQQSIVDSKYLK